MNTNARHRWSLRIRFIFVERTRVAITRRNGRFMAPNGYLLVSRIRRTDCLLINEPSELRREDLSANDIL